MCPSVSVIIVEIYCQGMQEDDHDHVIWQEDQEQWDRNIPNNCK